MPYELSCRDRWTAATGLWPERRFWLVSPDHVLVQRPDGDILERIGATEPSSREDDGVWSA